MLLLPRRGHLQATAVSRWGILIPLASSQQNLNDIYLLLCVKYEAPDDGRKTCPKYTQFYSKSEFEKFVHLFGFIV